MGTSKDCGRRKKKRRKVDKFLRENLHCNFFFWSFMNSIWNVGRMVANEWDFSFFVFGKEMNKKRLDWLLKRY